MTCTRCGQRIDRDPVWAKYADQAFKGKPLDAFALHSDCFAAAEFIPISEWENDENGASVLVDKGTARRYRKVKAPASQED